MQQLQYPSIDNQLAKTDAMTINARFLMPTLTKI